MSVLSVKDVKKVYGSKIGGSTSIALNGVSFEVEKGEFVGIMGPSGAGKSTLLNVIATIDTVTSGQISVGGQDICKIKEPALSDFRRSKLGFIFQDYNLLDTLTLKENIALPLILSKKSVNQIEASVKNVATHLGIEDILKKYPYEVSGGQKQRASAARAIVNNPEMILADEPTGALDSKSSKDLLQCMQNLIESDGATILLVTHDAFAASFCKRIVFIKDGLLFMEIINTGSRKEFFDKILKVLSSLGGDNSEVL
ncbi:ABC transporter ATP-binding protein [Clostridium estertheticum]|uniref:ABC transporter ATP-binding protein n=1 Tax=Clostridium estertheticum TaxID=238834 RepID=UPI001CF271C7|nr:ABC transporter ATP-binding protein [Clostridium estertheticum]MCB2354704.1 ABC transporter ATP-binding protein [Clostridium estertheticum]WAG40948.1 ABC transporter ATP-binding protein [Clostridium estertheticum]